MLNRPESRGATILVGGHNFGCGSSREHAPWALLDFGIRAVVSTEIADIFRSNSFKNGLVPVIVDAATHAWLLEHPGAEVAIDVAVRRSRCRRGTRSAFPIDKFSRYCLMNGIDQLGFLLEQDARDRAYERKRRMMRRIVVLAGDGVGPGGHGRGRARARDRRPSVSISGSCSRTR